ncbi:hypothetical protein MtrunA17_Chr7g0232551 [Medicago truncatula]|uniref:Uncharacterized protein n=1 Tax=Medicago truncatula TaxID=3880 RepID=A0A396GWT2_MEDTR|nr:hypothetical protein MtrunA17_Chr7g0232551 [Medicago truncatula]
MDIAKTQQCNYSTYIHQHNVKVHLQLHCTTPTTIALSSNYVHTNQHSTYQSSVITTTTMIINIISTSSTLCNHIITIFLTYQVRKHTTSRNSFRHLYVVIQN